MYTITRMNGGRQVIELRGYHTKNLSLVQTLAQKVFMAMPIIAIGLGLATFITAYIGGF